jgi:hypothetical protein
MFNGIIYNTGVVEKVFKGKNSSEINLKTPMSFSQKEVKYSIRRGDIIFRYG